MNNTIYEADFLRTLPGALTLDPKMRALATLMATKLHEISTEMKLVSIYQRIDELSEKVLDILAFDFNVDMYDYNYPIEVKREVIKNSFKTSKIKGTKFATEQALRSVWRDSEIEEWFEYGGEPYHFRAVCDGDSIAVTAGTDKVSEIIRKQKRLSAHMDEIIFQCHINCVIATHAEHFRYETPLTGRLAAGTAPGRNRQGGEAASVILVDAGAECFIFTSKQAGTIPGRNIEGADENGTLVNSIDAAEFIYTAKACGSTRRL